MKALRQSWRGAFFVKGLENKIFSLQDNALGTPTAPVTLTSTTFSGAQNTGTGTPNTGIYIIALFSSVVGNPNVLFSTQVSQDGVIWNQANADQYGIVESPCQRYIRLATDFPYWRVKIGFEETDPGESSSSSSGGSIGPSVEVFVGVAPSKLG
jgi:hypothetical protein